MKNITKILLVVLAMCLILASCDGTKPVDQTGKPTGGSQVTNTGTPASGTEEGTKEIDRKDVKDKLPDNIDMGGEEICIYVRGGSKEVDVPEKTEDLINDAVYDRARRVEERLKCKIKTVECNVSQNTMANELRTLIKANDESCDLICTPRYYAMALAPEGYLNNIYDYEQIDLEAPWWQKGFTNAGKLLEDKVYFISGDASYNSTTMAGGLGINTSIYTEKIGDMADLYKTVIDRKWVLDKFIEVCKDIYEDLNGDGEFDDGDLYGAGLTPNAAMIEWYTGLGVELCRTGDDGLPELTLNSEHTVDVYNKTLEVLYSTTGVLCPGASQAAYDLTLAKFKDGTLMFFKTTIGAVSTFRDMSADYSIIPFPMYDEAQGEYRSYTADSATMWGIPTSAPDPDSAATFLEAFAADGYRFVTPQVYGSALKYAYSRDDMQSQMMDIIASTVTLNFANLHSASISGIEYFLTGLWANKGEFVSSYESKGPTFEKNLEDIIEKYKGIF